MRSLLKWPSNMPHLMAETYSRGGTSSSACDQRVTWLTHQSLHVDTAEAKQQVPSLVLVNGEDLTPYRQASKRIFGVLARFGVAERLGMDEVLLSHVFVALSLHLVHAQVLKCHIQAGHKAIKTLVQCCAHVPYFCSGPY